MVRQALVEILLREVTRTAEAPVITTAAAPITGMVRQANGEASVTEIQVLEMDLHRGAARPVTRGEAPLLGPRGGNQQEVAQPPVRDHRTAVPEGLVRQAPPAGQPAHGVPLEVVGRRDLHRSPAPLRTTPLPVSPRTRRPQLHPPVQPVV